MFLERGNPCNPTQTVTQPLTGPWSHFFFVDVVFSRQCCKKESKPALSAHLKPSKWQVGEMDEECEE